MTVSPDLNPPNISNAAPALQFPGGEPVEIFQAELFTILEKLASGATPLSAEDELEETESLDDDSGAKDETIPAAWISARPAFTILPELRTQLSLDCFGRLDASTREETVPEEIIEPAESTSQPLPLEEAIAWFEQAAEEQGSRKGAIPPGQPGEAEGDLAFEAEVSRAEIEGPSSLEKTSSLKQDEIKRETVREPSPLSRGDRHSDDDAGKQHGGERNANLSHTQPSHEAIISAPQAGFDSSLRSESKNNAAPALPPSSLIEVSETLKEPSTFTQQPLRELSIGIASDQTRVGVQVRESEGTLHVSVRTPDAAVSAVLQQNLDDLAASLSKQGMDAQFWTAADDRRIETRASESAGDPGQSAPDWQDQGRGGQDGNSQQKQNQRSSSAWLNAFTIEEDSEGQTNEVISWPFTSQIFPTRR